MRKVVGFLTAVGMVLALSGGPASAAVGVFTGNAIVAQGTGACGDGSLGLGLPIVHGQNRNAHYRLTTPVIDIINGSGLLDICGRLTSVATVGAACGMSKGYGGTGSIQYPGGLTFLTRVGWKFSVGGILPVTGNASGSKNGTLYALVDAEGVLPCLKNNARDFFVVGAYVIVEGGPRWNDVTNRIDPKNDGPSCMSVSPPCLNIWGDKK